MFCNNLGVKQCLTPLAPAAQDADDNDGWRLTKTHSLHALHCPIEESRNLCDNAAALIMTDSSFQLLRVSGGAPSGFSGIACGKIRPLSQLIRTHNLALKSPTPLSVRRDSTCPLNELRTTRKYYTHTPGNARVVRRRIEVKERKAVKDEAEMKEEGTEGGRGSCRLGLGFENVLIEPVLHRCFAKQHPTRRLPAARAWPGACTLSIYLKGRHEIRND